MPSPFAAREALGAKDGRTLAREWLGMSQTEFSAAFKSSPMKREAPGAQAQRGRRAMRQAEVLLGNKPTRSDFGEVR
jgi:hypothetical protein